MINPQIKEFFKNRINADTGLDRSLDETVCEIRFL